MRVKIENSIRRTAEMYPKKIANYLKITVSPRSTADLFYAQTRVSARSDFHGDTPVNGAENGYLPAKVTKVEINQALSMH